ncbi:MAG: winged helix-turn-helix domain-containing protein, partial [Pseudomonadales bacterium]|nr:winged helix-turn-helix domain-containing protein [Pseudomonadales bacterium]
TDVFYQSERTYSSLFLLSSAINQARFWGFARGSLLRYTQFLITQIAQTAVCNRHHSIERRLSTWLLNCFDRLTTNQMTITQELISHMLGVRREGVTKAAGKLHELGIVDYERGHLRLLDRSGLEALACECYAVVRHQFECVHLRKDCVSGRRYSGCFIRNPVTAAERLRSF